MAGMLEVVKRIVPIAEVRKSVTHTQNKQNGCNEESRQETH